MNNHQFLEIQPIWPPRPSPDLLTPEIVETTNRLQRICTEVFTTRGSLATQVNMVRATGHKLTLGKLPAKGEESVSTVVGNSLDDAFKTAVRAAQFRGEIPKDLKITSRTGLGPDLVWGRTAWELTSAEQARAHIRRDLGPCIRWDLYFVLSY